MSDIHTIPAHSPIARRTGDEHGWTELRIVTDTTSQDRLLVEALVPFVRASGGGMSGRVFFLRERIGSTPRLRLWVSDASDVAIDELDSSFRGAAERVDATARIERIPDASADFIDRTYGGAA